ncbi:MAG: 2-amino-4-hydroxy-6-hydroxymethyldihydropteridine diphosphokinase [Nitrospinota bacterium]
MNGGKSDVLIGVGSNISPFQNIEKALTLLREQTTLLKISPFYRSKPHGFSDQDDFINGCIVLTWEASPEELKFNILKKIEERTGRVRTENKNGARTIDLDILLFGELVLKKKDITIPDPETFKRNYILYPAKQIAGDMVNPHSGKRLQEYDTTMAGLTPVSLPLLS